MENRVRPHYTYYSRWLSWQIPHWRTYGKPRVTAVQDLLRLDLYTVDSSHKIASSLLSPLQRMKRI